MAAQTTHQELFDRLTDGDYGENEFMSFRPSVLVEQYIK